MLVPVIDHVTIRTTDRAASEAFYRTVFEPLGIAQTHSDEHLAEWDDFSLSPTTPEKPATRRLHIGFVAPSREHVEAFWETGMSAGFRDDGEPGPRPQYRYDYYGAFLLDPDGNSAEAVHHGDLRHDGTVDHLWIRVADVEAAKAFYAAVAPYAGLQLGHETPDHVHFTCGGGSFSLVRGEPTENLHMAFSADADATVDAFHRAALEAGHRDNGAPGERPVYHPGYYGAFVLDPDGNNIEVVNHNRP
jgi:catechol 2,3-dioxygenase-like lactoylglutathione lyase family enzyme